MAKKIEPIRDIGTLDDISRWLKGIGERYWLLFELCVNAGLRMSEALRLRVEDVAGRDCVVIFEQKKKRIRMVPLNSRLRGVVSDFVPKDANRDAYLFRAQGGENRPMTQTHALKIIQEACERQGVEHFGAGVLRKTFEYHYRRAAASAPLPAAQEQQLADQVPRAADKVPQPGGRGAE